MALTFIRFLISITLLILTAQTFAATVDEKEYQAITERIKPVGDVYLAGAEPVAKKRTEPRDGATVFNTFCTACHTTGAAGAPIRGNHELWAPRVAKGMDVLTNHALNGFNAMPARGSCMDCTDEEVVAAIKYLTDGMW